MRCFLKIENGEKENGMEALDSVGERGSSAESLKRKKKTLVSLTRLSLTS